MASFAEELEEAKRLSKLMSKPPAKAMPQAVHSLLLTYWPESFATAGVKTAVSLLFRSIITGINGNAQAFCLHILGMTLDEE